MSEQHRKGDGDVPRRRSGERPAPDGVVLVSVGRARGQTSVKGVRQAHVARIHDLPSLIHALTIDPT